MKSDNPDRFLLALRGCYLFSGVNDGILQELARGCRLDSYPAGHALFDAGDEADGLRIIVAGLIRVWINDEDGKELTITLVEAGDPLGEIALLDGRPRSANATTLEESTCLFLPSVSFEEVLNANPQFARQIIISLCEILRRNTRDLSGFAFDTLHVRLARKIHELAFIHALIDGGTAKFDRLFSQTELANMLGATREAVNKRLAEMVKARLISFENGRIVVIQLDELAKVFEA